MCIREFITAVEGSSARRHLHQIFILGLRFVKRYRVKCSKCLEACVKSKLGRGCLFIYLSQSFASSVFRNILISLLLLMHDDDW